jgi:hypothetical protein
VVSLVTKEALRFQILDLVVGSVRRSILRGRGRPQNRLYIVYGDQEQGTRNRCHRCICPSPSSYYCPSHANKEEPS